MSAIARRSPVCWLKKKGFDRHDLFPRVPIDIRVDGKQARVRLDLIVRIDKRIALLVKYAPGSLTTRHQVALAASRLLAPYQVPFSVVTNGEEADIIDNYTGTLLDEGLDNLFTRRVLETRLKSCKEIPVSPHFREMAARILYAYEVDGRCPCDDTVCEFEHRESSGS